MGVEQEWINKLLQKYKEKAENRPSFGALLDIDHYINHQDVIAKFFRYVQAGLLGEGGQSKFLIGLVQSTLSGKTKLLIQSSYNNPVMLILIPFKSTNHAYHRALLPSISIHNHKYETYDERLWHNRSVMLKVRYFIMAYLDFALLYKRHCCNNQPWGKVTQPDKQIFQALLLNGGGDLIEELYRLRISKLVDDVSMDVLINLKEEAQREFARLVKELENPWLALDECHVPQEYGKGLLFHSDYDSLEANHPKQQLVSWQLYEQFPQDYREPPEGYRYLRATSLFSAFRYLAEEFLTNNSIMTIFVSTYFSCWESLLDRSKYSCDKPQIQPFSALPLLKMDDILSLLQSILEINASICNEQKVRAAAAKWEGRPGFFFEYCLRLLVQLPRPITIDKLETTFNKAEELAINFLGGWLNKVDMQPSSSIKQRELTILSHLRFILKVQNGHTHNKTMAEDLIACGLAIKKENTETQQTIAVVEEPLTRKFLELSMQDIPLLSEEHVLVNNYTHDKRTLAEKAIMLQLLQSNGTIAFLLQEWGCTVPSKLKCYLHTFLLEKNFVGCGDFKELNIKEASSVISPSSLLWKKYIIKVRTGLALPDILAAVTNDTGDVCLLSIQVKTRDTRLSLKKKSASETQSEETKSDSTFVEVIKNVSRQHFLSGHGPQHALVQQNWENYLNSFGSKIMHIRIIVCWAGFTEQQNKYVQHFNSIFPNQPIFLVEPTRKSKKAIYGDIVFGHLQNMSTWNPLSNHKSKRFVKEVTSEDVQFMRMELHDKESVDLDSEECEDNEEYDSELEDEYDEEMINTISNKY